MDFDGRSDGDEGPDLVNFLVGDGDAAQGPVIKAVSGTDEAPAIGQAVDHDRSAGRDAEARGALAVVGVGVGDVQRLVIFAAGVAAVDDVVPFGCGASPSRCLEARPPVPSATLYVRMTLPPESSWRTWSFLRMRMESACGGGCCAGDASEAARIAVAMIPIFMR